MTNSKCKGITFKVRILNYVRLIGKRSSYEHSVSMGLVTSKVCSCQPCKKLLNGFYAHIDETGKNVLPDKVKDDELYKLVHTQFGYIFEPFDDINHRWRLAPEDATHYENGNFIKLDPAGDGSSREGWLVWANECWLPLRYSIGGDREERPTHKKEVKTVDDAIPVDDDRSILTPEEGDKPNGATHTSLRFYLQHTEENTWFYWWNNTEWRHVSNGSVKLSMDAGEVNELEPEKKERGPTQDFRP